jgi:Flp pilus assembly protein TadD
VAIDERTELEAAAEHHRAGRLDAARVGYERVLTANPRNHQALDLLGVVHAFQGRIDDSIAVLRRAVDIAPDFPPALNHLGLALKSRREYGEAVDCLKRAIEIAPDFAEAHINLGNAMLEQGRGDEALVAFREAIRLAPGSALAHNNLGLAFSTLGKRENAEAAYRQSLSLNERSAETHKNLGSLLAEAGREPEAIPHLKRALELRRDDADLEYRLGLALSRSADAALHAEAASHFAKAETLARRQTEASPQNPAGWEALGNSLLRQGRTAGAFAARLRATSIVRAPGPHGFDHLPTYQRTSATKLDHDIEQIEHLLAHKAINATDGTAMLNAYRTVRARLPQPKSGRLVDLGAEDRRLIGATYNRLWHMAPGAEISSGAVDTAFDRAAIEADYFGRAPGITWLDGLLTPPALAGLRRFCLESTMWFNDAYANGYLGAFAEDGFNCPLLLQIGRELPQRLPGIFGDHKLLKVWAFKYGQKPEGIAMHADFAAINVNFWITPDEANLDPESGGLIVWDKEAPAAWDFETYNLDHAAMQRFLDESGAQPHRVPHRQNRAVVFNSDLIHRTDEIRFRDGYESRRINVTFLYGERGGRI